MAKKIFLTEGAAYKEAKKAFITDKGIFRKVKKGFITKDGVYRLFFSGLDVASMAISYSGNHTDEIVTMGDGKQYRLLTLTSTGTLTLEEEVTADVWVCGGGLKAQPQSGQSGYPHGGDGSKFNQASMNLKDAVIAVGSGNGGTTSVNNGTNTITNTSTGAIAGAGGGKGVVSGTYYGNGGAKAGGDTRPFKDSYFTSYPCAGGGGGSYGYDGDSPYTWDTQGGEGGSSLRAGNKGTATRASAAGGVTGGGKGGDGNGGKGGNGSYYGSGGGGGGWQTGVTGGAGSGYQGVCYIRIPLEQAA